MLLVFSDGRCAMRDVPASGLSCARIQVPIHHREDGSGEPKARTQEFEQWLLGNRGL